MSRPEFPKIIDSTWRKDLSSCGMKFNYSAIQRLKPKGISIHLHFGGCFAKGVEVFRKSYYGKAHLSVEGALIAGVEAIIRMWGTDVEIAPEKGNKSLASCIDCLYSFVEQYDPAVDPIQPVMIDDEPAVEFNFAFPISDIVHPTTGEPILYTGRFDMLAQYQGGVFVCVTPGHEVLTKNGWLPIENIIENEPIAQWDCGEISFVPAEKIELDYKGDLFVLDGRKVSLEATPEHRQPVYERKKGLLSVAKMESLMMDSRFQIPHSGKYRNKDVAITDDFIKLIVAIQADSTITEDGLVRFSLKKERKIKRLLDILHNMNLPYKKYHTAAGFTLIHLMKYHPSVINALVLLGPKKEYGSWLLSLGGRQLELLVEELKYWDGSIRGNTFVYCTNSENNAEWTRIAGTLCGYYTACYYQQKEDYKPNIRVGFTKEAINIQTIKKTRTHYDGKVYCVRVPSSFFLIRKNGKVIVTGNCDEKTAGQLGDSWQNQWEMASQLTGYIHAGRLYGYPVQGAVLHGVCPLKNDVKHILVVQTRTQWEVDRWMHQLQRDLRRAITSWESGDWDYSLDSACAGYGGCPYMTLCKAKEPEKWVDTYYEENTWNPLEKADD